MNTSAHPDTVGKLVLSGLLALSLAGACLASVTPSLALAATRGSSSASASSSSSHTGKIELGTMSVTIPKSAECVKFDTERESDGETSISATWDGGTYYLAMGYSSDGGDFASYLATDSETVLTTLAEGADMTISGDVYDFKATDGSLFSMAVVIGESNVYILTVSASTSGEMLYFLSDYESDEDFETLTGIFESITGGIGSTGSSSSSSSSSGRTSSSGRSSSSSSSSSSSRTSTATTGERNALSSAQAYLNVMPFSYSGLVEQLEYEGYSHAEATYAADNCGADWYEQAALCAQTYLNVMSFSRSGLIEQLEYEGFTPAQAEYGVKAVGY